MRRIIYISVLSVLLAGASSCIKEDRDDCPCYLSVAHEGFDWNGYKGGLGIYAYGFTGLCFDETFAMDELVNDEASIGVRRGLVDVVCAGGVKNMYSGLDHVLRIPLGKECDNLYLVYDRVDANRERAYIDGRLTKQYANVRVSFNATDDFRGSYAVKVRSNTDAVDMMSMEPMRGRYEFVPSNWMRDVFSFNLPRQVDNSTTLELWGCDSQITADGYIPEEFKLLSTFKIGRYIVEEIGYDWSEDSLKDIEMTLDFSQTSQTITVEDWELVSLDVKF